MLQNFPMISLRALLGFLGEPYAPECLTSLQKRINSSDVPADFRLGERGTDPLRIERATRLNAESETNPQASEVKLTAVVHSSGRLLRRFTAEGEIPLQANCDQTHSVIRNDRKTFLCKVGDT